MTINIVPRWSMLGFGLATRNSIYVREDAEDIAYVIAHEVQHAEQIKVCGSSAKFYWEYAKQVAKYGYYKAPFEVDARKFGMINKWRYQSYATK